MQEGGAGPTTQSLDNGMRKLCPAKPPTGTPHHDNAEQSSSTNIPWQATYSRGGADRADVVARRADEHPHA